jgi:hypothetical protein
MGLQARRTRVKVWTGTKEEAQELTDVKPLEWERYDAAVVDGSVHVRGTPKWVEMDGMALLVWDCRRGRQ